MELYGERGFEDTTVAEIATRAGLTERTFYRYFADKREVLFSGAELLEQLLVDAVAAAPDSASPLDAVVEAFEAAATGVFEERRDFAAQRQRIIAANVDLQEREISKLASLAAEIADALRRRGVPGPTAGLSAEAGMAVFRLAFARWVDDAETRDLRQLISDSLAELRAVTAAA
jgi:AcrR family transcriptional regulator